MALPGVPRNNRDVSAARGTSKNAGRLVVAINPLAFDGRNRDLDRRVVARLRDEGYHLLEVTGATADEQRRLVSEALRPGDTLVVVGGDGMVNIGINAVAGTRIPLAVMPAGTGNDFARGLGYPVDDKEASLDLLLTSLTRPPTATDAARVTTAQGSTLYGCVLSAGFDAFVNERANRMRFPRGRSRYTWAILFELLRLRPRHYELTVDGVTREQEAVLISVANNRLMGGGMLISPNGSLTDGLLEVFVVRPVTRRRFLRIFPRVFAGRHLSEPEVSIETARKIRLNSLGIVAYADGDRIGELPVEIEVVPGALLVHRFDLVP